MATKNANLPQEVQQTLSIIPELSGSYQYYDKDGEIIYVGKAKNLKKRVYSYFNKHHDSPKLRVMVPQIAKIQFIVTDSEVEALILESHLIKKHKPKYNVLLKDDKKFPYFVITEEEYPRIIVARKANKNKIKGKYFGPYTDSRAMYATLDLIKKLFPLKQCKNPKFKDRPCLYYHIGRCMAPCQRLITPDEYKKILKNVELFLTGKQKELVDALKKEMEKYAAKEDFEKAARYRDSWMDVQKTMEHQKVVFENTNINQDIIAVYNESNLFVVSLLQIRQGRLTDKKDFQFSNTEGNLSSEYEVLTTFLKEYYTMASESEIPNTIVVPKLLEQNDTELYTNWLASVANKKVKISDAPTKRNIELLNLAQKNAKFFFEKVKLQKLTEIQRDYNEVGSYIQEKLGLTKFPYVVECFDISHIQGTNTVASMVTFENGLPKKSRYRKFKVRSTESKPDDFKSLQEVVERRYFGKLTETLPMPDLIIIDGGKGQLSSVMEIFESKGLEVDVVSLAKRLEEVFKPHKSEPVIFPINSPALYFFQRIRDEAHRFAITYHRKLRGKKATESVLDEIKGLSSTSKETLMKEFKDVKKISKASYEELCEKIPKRSAKAVYNFFNPNVQIV
ncbi:MAG TPA: excinuclease ABC subunit UvrC [Candidatus Limenecus avicola]|uniref:UvrABC system protein C n=1 Tax=Candidatus Limenecus avicola TaxID=2840847 RepID=A0A9D1SRL4_9CLOT|nr:excinuclease ABC subunit UvrC [Candidatus Limenecus avicola]